jgi:sn-glycerol 3-phosphate transport system permease protein
LHNIDSDAFLNKRESGEFFAGCARKKQPPSLHSIEMIHSERRCRIFWKGIQENKSLMNNSIPASFQSPNKLNLSGVQRREIKKFSMAMLFLAPSLIIFLAFTFIPLIQSILLSLYLTDPIGRPAAFVWFLQYERLVSTPNFLNSFTRSVQFVLYTVPTTIFLSLGLAILGNLRLKRISIFRVFFSSTIAVSAATASLMFLYLFHPTIGSLNYFLELVGLQPVSWLVNESSALPSVALTSVWLQLGLNTVIILAAMQGIPEELYESAMIDGANSWNKFIHITVPFLSSTFFFLLVVDILAAFQTFTPIHVMTSGGPADSTNLLVYSIYREFYFNGKYGFAAAQSIMLFVIMLILTTIQFGVLERKVFYE